MGIAMTIKDCAKCGKTFKRAGNQDSHRWKFCSRRCKADFAKETSGSTRKCKSCQKKFYAKGNPKTKVFCSKKCFSGTMKSGKEVACLFCSKIVYRRLRDIEKNDKLFCTKKCFDSYATKNSIRVQIKCKICQKSVWRYPSRIGFFCSNECRFKDKDWATATSLKANLAQLNKKGLNRLEKRGSELLDELRLPHKTQVPLFKKFLVDVVLDGLPIIIQWDGIYWHTKKKRMLLDKSQDAYMKKCGMKVLRFTDKEVYGDPSKVKDRILFSIAQSRLSSTPNPHRV